MAYKKKYSDDNEAPRAYGQTLNSLDDLKIDQAQNTVPKVKCNKNPDFEIPEHEAEHFYVVLDETPLFDQYTGKRLTKPKVKKYNKVWMKKFLENNFFNGKTIEIIHDPTIQKKHKAVTKANEEEKKEQNRMTKI